MIIHRPAVTTYIILISIGFTIFNQIIIATHCDSSVSCVHNYAVSQYIVVIPRSVKINSGSIRNSGVSSDHPLNHILEGINDGAHDENDAAEFVRAALLAFHKRHYTPNKMTAVLVGPQSLDELESWAVPRFGRIPDRWNSDDDGKGENEKINDDDSLENGEKWRKMQLAAARLIDESALDAPPVSIAAAESVTYNPAFRPDLHGGQWPVVVTTKPIKDIRKLVLFFPLPPTWRSPDRSPTQALSHLFGHEGTGSAFALLQDKGWITSLSTGNRVHEPDQCLFKVEMTLTPEGEEHWAEATGAIFAYAKMVQLLGNGGASKKVAQSLLKTIRKG